jgi:hypothetical protein
MTGACACVHRLNGPCMHRPTTQPLPPSCTWDGPCMQLTCSPSAVADPHACMHVHICACPVCKQERRPPPQVAQPQPLAREAQVPQPQPRPPAAQPQPQPQPQPQRRAQAPQPPQPL